MTQPNRKFLITDALPALCRTPDERLDTIARKLSTNLQRQLHCQRFPYQQFKNAWTELAGSSQLLESSTILKCDSDLDSLIDLYIKTIELLNLFKFSIKPKMASTVFGMSFSYDNLQHIIFIRYLTEQLALRTGNCLVVPHIGRLSLGKIDWSNSKLRDSIPLAQTCFMRYQGSRPASALVFYDEQRIGWRIKLIQDRIDCNFNRIIHSSRNEAITWTIANDIWDGGPKYWNYLMKWHSNTHKKLSDTHEKFFYAWRDLGRSQAVAAVERSIISPSSF
ncbi:hypothetical protein EV673_0346 [Limnobacter thiooxidans]|uniref:Uncharacterized protein n=1 Tax=Limnobacter thiooxidans TaxID=131080 RepID=A0AA86J7N0_9BURK|nr:hypothetical protein EV673_0346 [Limnobacter thiooxidans]BET26540.1 hypothetical protein RGQ30_20410 [Limnobacter thiooxidans]